MKALLSLAALSVYLVATAPGPVQAAALPVAPVQDVPETFFGTTVHDPYRWMEDSQSPAARAWMKAHSAHASATLARIPGREAFYRKLLQYDASVPERVAQVAREPDGTWVYEQRGARDNQFKLVLRRPGASRVQVLVDPNAMSRRGGEPHAINYFAVSPGARVLAYGLSGGGSEDAVLHLHDVASGRALGQPIDRTRFGGVGFSPDGSQLLFNRLQEMTPSTPERERYANSAVWRLAVGAPTQQARKVFGLGIPGADMKPEELPFVSISHDGRWALATVVNGTQRELSVYLAPAAVALGDAPRWTRLFDASAAVTGMAYFDDTLYLLSHQGAPRSKVLALDLKAPDLAQARTVVATSERVISGVATAADALYIETRDGNIKRLFKKVHGRSEVTEVALPVAGSFSLNGDEGSYGAADPRLPGLLLDLQSWTRARQIYAVQPDGVVRNTGLQPAGRFDQRDDIVATEVKVPSHDGALVPLSIIHRQGVKLDGRNPTVLYGYASYGVTEEPFFSPTRLAWLDAGGVFAVANPRGSSVYGEDWYKGGFQATKPNTWKDFIACAEYLVRERYASPATLGIWGGSAGGILVGRAMTERPDLFAAVVPSVGALDMVRSELTPNGVPNIPEFGSRVTEPGFRALLAMSTYHQIQDGVAYPAVLFTHGVNDPRVEVWNSTKTAARLLAASSAKRPVLLRLDWQAGHGIGNTKAQTLQERADIYSFLLWQLGGKPVR